jgi:hypothetical protein
VHHTLAWFENIAQNALNDLTPVPDGIVAIQNAHFIFEEDHPLLFAWVGSATLNRARFVTPKLRQISLPFIRPTNVGVTPAVEGRVADYRPGTLVFRQREELAIEAFQTAVGAEDVRAVAGFGWPSITPAPNGERIKFRGTSVTAATINAWTDLVMTFADILPWGTYAVVGLEVQSANAIAARLILENVWPRPGSVSIALLGNQQDEMFSDGGLGEWGRFHSTRMPGIQVFAAVADAAHEVFLDLVRVS